MDLIQILVSRARLLEISTICNIVGVNVNAMTDFMATQQIMYAKFVIIISLLAQVL
jgi:hypothetical protein